MGAAKFPAVGKFDNLAGFEPVSWQRLPTRSGIDGKAHSRATTANDPEQVERHLNATQSIVAKIFQRGIHVASLSTDSAGRRRIQFVDTNGKRRAVRLGKVSMREASEIKTKIEAIVDYDKRVQAYKEVEKFAIGIGATIPLLQSVTTVARKRNLGFTKYRNGWILPQTMGWA